MKGKDLLELIERIDPAYIEEAEAIAKEKKKVGIKAGLVAVCLCLVLGIVAVFAFGEVGTQVIKFFKTQEKEGAVQESGYKLSAAVQKIPVSKLYGRIKEFPLIVMKQLEIHKAYDSWMPGYWMQKFTTRDAAYDYIGLEELKRLQWDLAEEETSLSVSGTEKGEIHEISVETRYRVGDIRVQFFTNIYTENYEGEVEFGTRSTEEIDFTESYYTTTKQKIMHIIEASPLESGYKGMDGYLVETGILYHLHISYLEKDIERARKLLEEWAELF